MWASDSRFLLLVSASLLNLLHLKNLIVMQKLEPRTVGLKPQKLDMLTE